MSIFDALTMIGGLCLFLFGMNIMGQALERRAGGQLQSILARLTKNKAAGFLTGLGVTSVIQSSSATTVMVVGFVNSGIMTLKQAINVIMGANVGTTVTAWILSLGGIDGDNIVMKLLKPTSFTPVLALIGIIFYMFCKSDKKHDNGLILLGFATLMFGMDTMSDAVSGLADVPAFTNILIMFENPVLGVLAGAVLTGIIQSSSASVGILQALASTGCVSYGAAVPIIMGQNIGTCVTALLSSVGTNKNAKRAAFVHLSFNVIGTVVWLIVFSAVNAVFSPAILGESASMAGIAVAHSAFNILCTCLLLPMSGLLEKAAMTVIRDDSTEEKFVTLDERLLATPSVAIQQCRSVVLDMGEMAVNGLELAFEVLENYDAEKIAEIKKLEDKTDKYEDIIAEYLVKLCSRGISGAEALESTKLLKMIGDFERLSDHSVNLTESVQELKDKEIIFTPQAEKELKLLVEAVKEILSITRKAFENDDITESMSVEPLEQVIDDLKENLRTSHIRRLGKGECSIEAGFVWSDLLHDLERISDHCSNIAGCIIEASHNEMNLHEGLRGIRSDSTAYFEKYKQYLGKYQLNN
ncbi:MAG: Na/Pi cotransporter family protein [Oscillospiraceae bacterium]|nr:Na/Pi cotransporter family protein [Oscillospiraceae bacterium]MBQ6937433.1 Na/Pi cotransporter family protein [Clostridia bacterium]